jgi:Tol biopolymer transport system component
VVLAGLLIPGAAAQARAHPTCRCAPISDHHPIWAPGDTAIAHALSLDFPHVLDVSSHADRVLKTPTGMSSFAFSPGWSMIAAIVGESDGPGVGRSALVTFRSDGSDVRRLDTSFDTRPAWSPTGDRIAYVGADRALYSVEPDGTDRQRVVSRVHPYGAEAATWSPDGSMLGFSSGRDVFVVPAGGGEARNITEGLDGTHEDPAWSPRGDRIALVTNLGTAIDIVRIDGGPSLHVVSQLPMDYDGTRLSWSPDGQRLLYSHRYSSSQRSRGVYEIDVATGAQRAAAPFGMDATYSHDGTRIAFGGRVTTEPPPPETPDCVGVGIWIVPTAGGRPSLATRHCDSTPPTVSMHAPTPVVYGSGASLFGSLLPGFAPFVRGSAQPCGRRASDQITQANDGFWSRPIEPRVTTVYTAASDIDRATATVVVSPRLVLRQTSHRLTFELQVTAGRSFAGKVVTLVRSVDNRIVAARRLRLSKARTQPRAGTLSVARFRVPADRLQRVQWIQARLAKREAGPCYGPGVSNVLTVVTP